MLFCPDRLQEQFPLRPVGKMTLTTNVDNWFSV